MPDGARKTETRIFEEFNSALPGILSGLFGIVAVALKNERTVEQPTTIRMADAAAWLKAAEPGGWAERRNVSSRNRRKSDEVGH